MSAGYKCDVCEKAFAGRPYKRRKPALSQIAHLRRNDDLCYQCYHSWLLARIESQKGRPQ